MAPYRKSLILILLAVAAALGVGLARAGAADAPVALPLDAETSVAGMPVACTGLGQTRLDPKWQAYPVRLEVADAHNGYLADETVTISTAKGKPVMSVSCEAPWILLRPPPGAYRVEAQLTGSPAKPRSAAFSPPAKGQMRLVLQFPDS